MSDQQNTGGHDIKKMFLMIAGIAIGIVGGGYALWSWYVKPPPAESKMDFGKVAGSTQVSGPESPVYRELLRENNARGAQDAAKQNSSFIASIPLQHEVIVTPPVPAPKPTMPADTRMQTSRQDSGRTDEKMKALEEARQKALAGLLARIQSPAVAPVPASAVVLGGKDGSWSAWANSLPGSAVQQAALRSRLNAENTPPPQEVVPPYWRGAGEIYTGVDSDNSTTPVLGRFTSGPYKGAVLKAPEGAKLAGDGVVIHFTTMAWNGQNYKVDAYALQDDTLVANIATDVNHHYVRRIILPSFLKGLGGVGDLYAQANSQVVSNGFNTVTARPGMPDGTAVAGVIAGGTASQAAQVLSNDAARLPDRTVTVKNGEVVAIQFMSGVYSTDAQPPQGAAGMTTAPPALTPASDRNPSPSAAELRADAQARIRAAALKGESRE